jgi:hypothetical protein
MVFFSLQEGTLGVLEWSWILFPSVGTWMTMDMFSFGVWPWMTQLIYCFGRIHLTVKRT